MTDIWQQDLRDRIEKSQRVLIVSHMRPDGDAVGSLVGLGLSLKAAHKEVQMVLADGVPRIFTHLEGTAEVLHQPYGEFDLIIVVDCSDLDRVGGALETYGRPDLNIDHHITNLEFARINLVEKDAVSTTEILFRLIQRLKLPITKPIAAALLTGLITDTLGFLTNNMTPTALRVAAELMEYDVNMPYLYRRALVEKSYEALLFWGRGLSSLQREGRMIWATLTQADRHAVGYPGRDDADLINQISSIKEGDVQLVFIEQNDNLVKVSWRASPGYDTSKIALQFGGGGHKAASGAMIEGTLEQVETVVLKATRTLFEETHPAPA